MNLEDFNTYEQNQRMYGGSAGRKMGITYEGKNYLLPERLQQDFKELQEYYDADDWFMFDTLFEVVEATVKAYYLAGKI